MSFQQLIESSLASGLGPAQWFEYASRLVERRAATGEELLVTHTELWVALIETVSKYQGISARTLEYFRKALLVSESVAPLWNLILYTSADIDAKTLDLVAACAFEQPETQVETAIHNAVTSRPAQTDQRNTEEGYLRLIRRCVNLSKNGRSNGARLVALILSSLQKATMDDPAGIQAAAHTALKNLGDHDGDIPKVVLQAIRNIAGTSMATLDTEDDPMAAATGAGSTYVLAETPDPLAEALAGNSNRRDSYLHIKTPVYITCALQSVLEETWTWQSGRDAEAMQAEERADFRNLPTAYKDLIHLGPALTSSPSTFAYFLLQASFESAFSSLEDLRQGAKRDAESSSRPEDQIMANLSSRSETPERDRIAARIIKVGWKEAIWLLHELPASLRYWQWLSENGSESSDWRRDWKYPPTVAQSLSLIKGRYAAQLDGLDRVLFGADPLRNSPACTMDILCAELRRWSLLGVSEIQSRGLGIVDAASNIAVEAEVESLLERLVVMISPSDSHFPSHLPYDMLMQPGIWDRLGETVCGYLDSYWESASPVVTALSEKFALLQLVCLRTSPAAVLKRTVDAMSSERINLAIESDPQTAITNYGALVFLASTICFRYDLPLPIPLRTASRVYLVNELSSDEDFWLKGWIQAIFGTTGISDELLQATHPPVLLRLATTLVSQAIAAAISQVIDIETLHSGLSYFSQPLLSWCQAGIIDWLCEEIQRQGVFAGIYLDVLQLLLGSEDLPQSTIEANCHRTLALFEKGNGLELVLESSDVDTTKLIEKLRFAQSSISNVNL